MNQSTKVSKNNFSHIICIFELHFLVNAGEANGIF